MTNTNRKEVPAFNIRHFLEKLPNYISIDVETDGLGASAEIITASIAWSHDEGRTISSDAFHLDRHNQNLKQADRVFRKILNATLFNPTYAGVVVFHNAAFDLPILLRRYFRVQQPRQELLNCISRLRSAEPANPMNYRFLLGDFCKVYDTQALSRSLRNNKFVSHADPRGERCHSLKYLAREHLSVDHRGFWDTIGSANIRMANLKTVLEYNRKDAELTLQLFFHLRRIAKITEWHYFSNTESPFIMGIIGLNWRGLPFNFGRTKALANQIKTEMFRLETEIFSGVGWSFNLRSQRELSHALFGNANLTYLYRGQDRRLTPLYESETGQRKVDISTLVKLRKRNWDGTGTPPNSYRVLNQVIQYLEVAQAYEDIEKLQRHAVFMPNCAYRIFSKITADAKTGRIKCGSPNVLGIPKEIFTDSIIDPSDKRLLAIKEFKSVRSLISVDDPSSQEILSIDISGLDLGVITAGLLAHDKYTYWQKCFERFGPDKNHKLDTHLAILRRISPMDYQIALQAYSAHLGITNTNLPEYWVTKEQNRILDDDKIKEITFIHAETGKIVSLLADAISKVEKTAKKLLRDAMKTTNLAIPYNQGAAKLAKDLTEATGRDVKEGEARERLAHYHRTFPEIRKFQDSIANAVYHSGNIQSPFGRVIYADVFDELNMHHQESLAKGEPGTYEFIATVNGKYWYVRAESWMKTSESVIQDLRLKPGAKILSFSKITAISQINRQIFRKKQRADNSQFSKKSETNNLEQSAFEENMFAITHEIDQARRFGTSWEPEAEQIRSGWICDGIFQIPEKAVVLYRAGLSNPSSKFFRTYKSLLKVAKPFFATYCQAEATIVAKLCMNEIQRALEKNSLTASLLFFIHDQFDVIADKHERDLIRKIFHCAIESKKEVICFQGSEYPIRFFGDFEVKGEFFR